MKRDTRTSIELKAELDATVTSHANQTGLKEKILTAMVSGKNISDVDVELEDGYKVVVDKLVASTDNPCNAEKANGNVCNDILLTCNATLKLCVHMCEFKSCGSNGQCQVVHEDENGVWQEPVASCQCTENNGLYDHSGNDCMTATMKWKYVLAISCGVGGGLIVLLIVVVVFTCCKRRTPRKEEDLIDAYSEDGVGLRDFSSRRSLINPRYVPAYATDFTRSNEGFQVEDPYFYQAVPERRSWLFSPEGEEAVRKNARDSQRFQSNLRHVDVLTDYSIKRPRISSNPIQDERL